jgi:hypothetical protein
MLKTFAVGAMLTSAYAAAFTPGFIDTTKATAAQGAAAGDDLPNSRAPEPVCSQTGWPHYTDNCIRGRAPPRELLRQVRIVTVDRLPE